MRHGTQDNRQYLTSSKSLTCYTKNHLTQNGVRRKLVIYGTVPSLDIRVDDRVKNRSATCWSHITGHPNSVGVMLHKRAGELLTTYY